MCSVGSVTLGSRSPSSEHSRGPRRSHLLAWLILVMIGPEELRSEVCGPVPGPLWTAMLLTMRGVGAWLCEDLRVSPRCADLSSFEEYIVRHCLSCLAQEGPGSSASRQREKRQCLGEAVAVSFC